MTRDARDDRLELVKLIGRVEAMLEQADEALRLHVDADIRQRASDAIAKRQAEIAELFPPALPPGA